MKKRKDALETLLQMKEDYLTQEERTAKSVKISTQLKTIAQTVGSFKRHTDDVLKICKGADVEGYLDTQEEVVEAYNAIDGLCEALEAKQKRKDKVNSAALSNIILEKYVSRGSEKYLNFYTFFETFTETVLKKEMKALAKLEYLKKRLEDSYNLFNDLYNMFLILKSQENFINIDNFLKEFARFNR